MIRFVRRSIAAKLTLTLVGFYTRTGFFNFQFFRRHA